MSTDDEIFVLDRDSLMRLWLTEKVGSGRLSQADADKLWRQYRTDAKFIATYFSVTTDVALMKKLAADLRNPLGKVYFKSYGGKPHIVFKGHAGVRKILTGTHYGVQNAKIVNMGLGRAGVRKSVKGGAVVSIFLLTAWNIADYFLRDDATLGQLIGGIAGDVTKAAIAGGVGYATSALVFGTAVGTFALGPLAVAVVVGVGVGLLLDWIDNRYQLTERLKRKVDEVLSRLESRLAQAQQGMLEQGAEAARVLAWRLVDLAADAAIDMLRREADRLITWRYLPRF